MFHSQHRIAFFYKIINKTCYIQTQNIYRTFQKILTPSFGPATKKINEIKWNVYCKMFLALNDIWDLLPSYNPVGEATLGSHRISRWRLQQTKWRGCPWMDDVKLPSHRARHQDLRDWFFKNLIEFHLINYSHRKSWTVHGPQFLFRWLFLFSALGRDLQIYMVGGAPDTDGVVS